MRVTKKMVESYIERFNRNVDDSMKVRLAPRYGYYNIETLNGCEEVYTGMNAREAYMCVRGMLHAIGKLR